MENNDTPNPRRTNWGNSGIALRSTHHHAAIPSKVSNKVLVIGLGQLGLPVAKYVYESGINTYGYDISIAAIERSKEVRIKPVSNFAIEDFDVFIICVPTHMQDDMFSPQINTLLSVVDKISKEATKNGALVSIESTIPKGTSRRIFELLNHRLHVVHAPHRWYALEEKEHGVNQLRVIGGVSDCCLKAGMQFYDGRAIIKTSDNDNNNVEMPHRRNNARIGSSVDTTTTTTANTNSNTFWSNSRSNWNSKQSSLNIPMHPVSHIEIAETTKVVENAHRFLQIAFAEELYLYCQENNLNFPELRDALNTKWNVNILEPREGIGGHCLPKDTKMFLQSSDHIRSKILTAAVEADHEYKRYIQSIIQLQELSE